MDIEKPKVSDIDLGIDLRGKVEENNKLQQTEEWFAERRGNWTGSKIKNIMSCNGKGGKMDWSDPGKIYEFSKGIIKYVYERAMERKTDISSHSSSSIQMRYGNTVENFILKIGEEILGEKIEEVGVKQHKEIESLKASADGIIPKKGQVVEIKACSSWVTHYDRTFSNTDEKSVDFWQTQAEMLVWGFKECVYLVASPPKNIKDYIYGEKDLEDFKEECKISKEVIKASPFHQKAIIERVKIIEKVCTDWIEKGGDLENLFWETVDYLKDNAEETPEETPVKLSGKLQIDKKQEVEPEAETKPKNINIKDIPF